MPTLPFAKLCIIELLGKVFLTVKEQTPRPRKKSAIFFATINFPYTVIVY